MHVASPQKSNVMQKSFLAPKDKNFELSYVEFCQKIMYLIWFALPLLPLALPPPVKNLVFLVEDLRLSHRKWWSKKRLLVLLTTKNCVLHFSGTYCFLLKKDKKWHLIWQNGLVDFSAILYTYSIEIKYNKKKQQDVDIVLVVEWVSKEKPRLK